MTRYLPQTLLQKQQDPHYLADPYPFLESLREQSGGIDPAMQVAILLRYREVQQVLRNPEGFSARTYRPENVPSALKRYRPLFQWLSRLLLFMDGEDHRRLRTVIKDFFSPSTFEHYQVAVRIEREARGLLDVCTHGKEEGEMDVIRQFALPLPLRIIVGLLGLPANHEERYLHWIDTFTNLIGHFGFPTHPEVEVITTHLQEMESYLQQHIESLRNQSEEQRPQTLIGQLLVAQQEGAIQTEELIPMCWLLLVAGHHNTMSAISNLLLALLLHPRQMSLLREHLELLPRAVEEGLRHNPPAHWTGRIALRDLVIGGCPVRAGQGVLLSIGGANRDEERTSSLMMNPDQFDIERQVSSHLSFGTGPHACIGAPLARLEIAIALRLVLERFSHLELAASPAELEWANVSMRGLVTLPVRYTVAK